MAPERFRMEPGSGQARGGLEITGLRSCCFVGGLLDARPAVCSGELLGLAQPNKRRCPARAEPRQGRYLPGPVAARPAAVTTRRTRSGYPLWIYPQLNEARAGDAP